MLRGVEELSRLLKNSFSKKRKTQIWIQSNMLLNQRSKQHFSLSKTSLINKIGKHLDPKTHSHTLNKSNQFYISKTKLRQFSEHTLTHVFLVMAKSHCIYTYIKSSKEYCVLCVKNVVRLHKRLHVITIWDMRKSLNSHTIITYLMGIITFEVHPIT